MGKGSTALRRLTSRETPTRTFAFIIFYLANALLSCSAGQTISDEEFEKLRSESLETAQSLGLGDCWDDKAMSRCETALAKIDITQIQDPNQLIAVGRSYLEIARAGLMKKESVRDSLVQSARYIRKTLAYEPSHFLALYSQATQAIMSRNDFAVITAYYEFLEHYPDQMRSHMALAARLEALSEAQAAEAALTHRASAVELASGFQKLTNQSTYYFGLANAGKKKEAEKIRNGYINQQPFDRDLQSDLAVVDIDDDIDTVAIVVGKYCSEPSLVVYRKFDECRSMLDALEGTAVDKQQPVLRSQYLGFLENIEGFVAGLATNSN